MAKREFDLEEKIILRDHLALERTRLANERTLLSYVRTSLYFLLGAVALFEVEQMREVMWLAYVAFAISACLLVVGVRRFIVLRRSLLNYYSKDIENQPGKED